MYAVVRIGGKQYQVEEGQAIVTEKLPYDVGESVEFSDVLLIADGDDTLIGTPVLEGATVTAEVVDQFRGKKVIVYKYKPKQRYRRKKGHRQHYTRLMINSIAAGG